MNKCSRTVSFVLSLVLFVVYCNGAVTWNYVNQTDAATWTGSCLTGTLQSPVNLPTPGTCITMLNYNFLLGKSVNGTLSMTDNNYVFTPTSSQSNFGSLNIQDVNQAIQSYDAQRIIFKAYSEHSIAGEYFDIEMQIEFTRDEFDSSTSNQNVAFLSIFFNVQDENQQLSSFFNDFGPDTQNVTWKLINISDTINLSPNFTTYQGSYTTPNCTENVNWFIYNKVFGLNYLQVEGFRSFFNDATIFSSTSFNARKTQTLDSTRLTRYFCAIPSNEAVEYQKSIIKIIGFWWMVVSAVILAAVLILMCNSSRKQTKQPQELAFYCHPFLSILFIGTPSFRRMDRVILYVLTLYTISLFATVFVRTLGIDQNVDNLLYGFYSAVITYVLTYVFGGIWKMFSFSCCDSMWLTTKASDGRIRGVSKVPFFFYVTMLLIWAGESALIVWNTRWIPKDNYDDFAFSFGVGVFLEALVFSPLEVLSTLILPDLRQLYAFRGYYYYRSYDRTEKLFREGNLKVYQEKSDRPDTMYVDTTGDRIPTLEGEPMRPNANAILELMNTQN